MDAGFRTSMDYADPRGANDTAHARVKDGILSKADLAFIAANFGNKDGKTLTVEKLEQAGFTRADADGILNRSGKANFKEIGLSFGTSITVTLTTAYADPKGANDTAHAAAKDGLLSSNDLKAIAANFGDKDGKTLSLGKLTQAGFTQADAAAILSRFKQNKDFRDIPLKMPAPPPPQEAGGHVKTGDVAQVRLSGDYAYVFSSDNQASAAAGDKQIDLDEFQEMAHLKGDATLSVDDLVAAGFSQKDAQTIFNRVGGSANEAIAHPKGHSEFHAVGLTYETNVAEDAAVGVRITAELATNLVDSILHAGSAEDLHHALQQFEAEARAMMGDNFGTGLIAGLTEKVGHIIGSAAQAPTKTLALMSAMVIAQAIPGVNVAVNAALVAVGGMHVVHDMAELIGSLKKGDGYAAGKDSAALVVSAGLTAVGLKSLTHTLKATTTFAKGTVATVKSNGTTTNASLMTRTRNLQVTEKRGLEIFSTKSTFTHSTRPGLNSTNSTISVKGTLRPSGQHGHSTSITGTITHTVKDVKEMSHFVESSVSIAGP